jgi:hypothetical protein
MSGNAELVSLPAHCQSPEKHGQKDRYYKGHMVPLTAHYILFPNKATPSCVVASK